MLKEIAVIAGAFAALQGVSAGPMNAKRANVNEIAHRLPDKKVLIPPCVSEQILTSQCEGVSGVMNPGSGKENQAAYKDCLFGKGSTFENDQQGCLECKKAHNHLTPEQSAPEGLVWDSTQKYINWDEYNRLPSPQEKDTSKKNSPVEEYYVSKPEGPQNIGAFTFNGTKYPVSDNDTSASVPEPITRPDPIPQRQVALVQQGASIMKVAVTIVTKAVLTIRSNTIIYAAIREVPEVVPDVAPVDATKEEKQALPECVACQKNSSKAIQGSEVTSTVTVASKVELEVLSVVEKEAKVSKIGAGQLSKEGVDKVRKDAAGIIGTNPVASASTGKGTKGKSCKPRTTRA
ncbi:hypothetical protein ACCO45_009418 [Purpureocillium lilacinum]|uniref:Uncharacterized protein n=1 Tax=Purpureocillium lilacinum TaxID=33203 RepID=A0ACC4DJN6_PURLI